VIPDWLHWLETCPSTNTWALTYPDRFVDGSVVFTRQQTAGRGQYNRSWIAPEGVLTATIVLDRLPRSQFSGFSLVAGLAVIYAIEDLLPNLQDQLRLKWPNDIWLEDRKLAGILCESVSSAHTITPSAISTPFQSQPLHRLVVGVGLNRSVDFAASGIDPERIGNPISLHEVVSQVPDEVACLTAIRHYLRQAASLSAYHANHAGISYPCPGLAPLLAELNRRDALRGKTIALKESELIGQAGGIDASGNLLIELPDRTVHAVGSGKIRVVEKHET
jgi:BirA family biotin operon repressor/biotin-[acetyl-CoA-carboxylase] ligase